jgi:PAP_fibrillin
VIEKVRRLELDAPAPEDLLSDASKAKRLLDGTWYLQYTSPSQVEDADRFPDSWKPEFADEGESRIETKPFVAQGSVSAAGIRVDTADRVVKQIFDVDNSSVENVIYLDWGRVRVAGTFRPSTTVPRRAVVTFDTALIRIGKGNGADGDENDDDADGNGFTVNLGFFFSILAAIRGSNENGWLETTFVDDDIRIGRGNKGTLFVLTRDPKAVKP